MPSISEGLNISIIEAQVNGLKCYASSGVDKKTNITGNVQFLALDKGSKFWSNQIYEMDNSRDLKVKEKIPKEYDLRKSLEKISNYYLNITNKS
jgi:glycosyltransferase EpsF